jgi:hypothetical protein
MRWPSGGAMVLQRTEKRYHTPLVAKIHQGDAVGNIAEASKSALLKTARMRHPGRTGSGGAVAGALEDAQVSVPWTYSVAVLVGQDS